MTAALATESPDAGEESNDHPWRDPQETDTETL